MKKRYIGYSVLAAVLALSTQQANAQQGFGTNQPSKASAIEMKSDSKGLLIPRVALTSLNSFAPMSGEAPTDVAKTDALLVYNTATTGTAPNNVTPGYYYWTTNGTTGKWVRIATGADATQEPWKVQDTGALADDNQQDIYQEGKVAVGFTDADGISDKQLEVKGDFRSVKLGTDGLYHVMETNANVGIPQTIVMAADHSNPAAATDYKALSVSAQGAILSTSVNSFDQTSYVRAVDGEVQLETTNQTAAKRNGLTVAEEGVSINFKDSNSGLFDKYYFPRENGTVGQVMAVETSASGTAQLEWKDASDLVASEPWKVQDTGAEADDNQQNIYQEGKVAVGFTDADAVSDKQLEVKGDFKTETEVAGRTVGFETNYAGTGISMLYNMDDTTAPTDAGMIQLHQNSVHLIAQSPTNVGATQVAPGLVEYRAGNWGLTDGVSLHHMDQGQIFLSSGSGTANEDVTNLYVRKGEGILFSHTDENTDYEGQYRFPRTAGTVGQVLAVDTYTAAAEYSELSWQNVNDLVDVNEPWKIQNTTNDATANTDNIYQQGKVAVGFTDADAVSGKQLEVKGDVKTEFVDTDGYIYGFQTAMPGLNPSSKENLIYISDNADLSAATHSSYLGVNKSNVAFMNVDKTTAIEKANAITASIVGDGGVVGILSETSEGRRVGIGGATWGTAVEAAMDASQDDVDMKISIRPETGIAFHHDNNTSGFGDYTFPQSAPTTGQVLSASATSNTYGGKQLEWKNAVDLVKAAMPKFFYMPSVPVPTHDENTAAILTGTQTINLYDAYTQQFQFTGGIGQVRSDASSTIPVLPANELDYFITYYDTDVFENVTVSAAGVLTYEVKSTATITLKSFMNIVFKVRD